MSDMHRDKSIQFDSISIAKGIAIILMVVGHSGCPLWMHDFIYMFHMPFFFFVSGFCFKPKYLEDSKTFLVHRIKGLYFPFVKWGLVFVLLHNVFYKLYIFNDVYSASTPAFYDLSVTCRKCFDVICCRHYESLLPGYWFLISLLRGSIISYFLLRIFKGKAAPVCAISYILTILFAFFDLGGYGIRLSRIFIVIFLYTFGVVLRNNWRAIPGYYAIFMAAFIWLMSLFFYSQITDYTSHNILGYSVAAIVGCVMMLVLGESVCIRNGILSTLLIFIGKNTLTILTWHFLSFKLISYLIICLEHRDLCYLGCFPVIYDDIAVKYSSYWLYYAIIGVAIPCVMAFTRDYFRRIKTVKNA